MNWNRTLQALVVGAISLSSMFSVNVKAELNRMDALLEPHDSSIWNHLRADFRLDHQRHLAGVDKQRRGYLNYSGHIRSVLKRSTPYLYFINEELEKRNLPGELALIPMIESAYNPLARSSRDAAGLWQMIPSTGRNFGLVQNSLYDGRHDIYASTQAALNYLSRLNKKFNGDWKLAVAAYNAGEGAVQRAIERNRAAGLSTNVWSLRLPAQTRLYLQKFLALSDIIKHAEEYNINLPAIPNRPALILVKLNKQTDLTRAAEIAGISLKELYSLNPGYINQKTAYTPPNGPHHILLPISSAKLFTQQVASLQKPITAAPKDTPTKNVNNYLYQVRKGDSLYKIAAQHDTTVALLKQANTLSSNTLKVGQPLLLPNKSSPITAKAQAAIIPSKETARRINYRVQEGDSLSKIADVFRTSIQQLLSWNNQIANKSLLRPGDLLTIYVKN